MMALHGSMGFSEQTASQLDRLFRAWARAEAIAEWASYENENANNTADRLAAAYDRSLERAKKEAVK